jgi:uncharacterized membrane protein HdeD (DUF308 family)
VSAIGLIALIPGIFAAIRILRRRREAHNRSRRQPL